MRNTIVYYGVCTALMRDQGPISLQEVSICIIRHRTLIHPVAFAHGTSVPVFKESPPL
jgi:hypothetical protein